MLINGKHCGCSGCRQDNGLLSSGISAEDALTAAGGFVVGGLATILLRGIPLTFGGGAGFTLIQIGCPCQPLTSSAGAAKAIILGGTDDKSLSLATCCRCRRHRCCGIPCRRCGGTHECDNLLGNALTVAAGTLGAYTLAALLLGGNINADVDAGGEFRICGNRKCIF